VLDANLIGSNVAPTKKKKSYIEVAAIKKIKASCNSGFFVCKIAVFFLR
jgi:hypothetical protein